MPTETSIRWKNGWRSAAAAHRRRNRFATAPIRRSAFKPPRKPCQNRKSRRRTFMPSDALTVQVERRIDFMFQLTRNETEGSRLQIGTSTEPTARGMSALRFQSGTSKSRRGGRRYLPYAFTEQGVAMLSSVLHSARAVQVKIAIMRTFVRLREMLLSNANLARKLSALEKKYDKQFKVVFDAIRELMTPPEKPKRQIGFHSYE